MYNIRTDLAIETREMYRAAKKIDDEIPGVETDIDNSEKDILITKVKITSDVASKMLNKAKGEYITIEAPKLKDNDEEFNNSSIILSNHVGTSAPLAFELYGPKNIRFWGAYQMNSGLIKLYKYKTNLFKRHSFMYI